MNREYHRWQSRELGRDMEMLVFGHAGLPAIVFPTSQARFYEFEDNGMVAAVADKIDAGHLQLFCVDSVDAESWYNRQVGADWRIARQVQYDNYIVREVVPYVRCRNASPHLITMGCRPGRLPCRELQLQAPGRVYGLLFHERGLRPQGPRLSAGLLQRRCLLQPASGLPSRSHRRVVSQPDAEAHVPACDRRSRPVLERQRTSCSDHALQGHPRPTGGLGQRHTHDWPWWQRMAQVYL